jgi:light-regulated signal transduction histidine kinase (bacteriophytochrome)
MDPTRTPKPSILVVDDTPANLHLLHELLSGQGYQLRLAPGGELALRSVAAEPPDLVLLDVVMPRMDGFAVCRALKADPRTHGIPVIFISALSETEQKLQAFAVGGVDYVTKPFQSAEVLARVQTHLELQRHRRALQELNERLQRSNQDLEQFAQVVAHDLKGPLQSIMGFSDLLLLSAEPDLGQEAQGYIQYIQSSTLRMARLVDSLLQYARVSNQVAPFQPVDLGVVAARVREDLSARIASTGATVEIGSLPTVLADETQMWQLLGNLVGNALKFHRPGVPPRVVVSSEPRGRQVSISVRDEGLGFDMRDKNEIFAIFRRLPEHSAVEGTGVGLAVCKKIVERHGGDIDVISAPGVGTTFTFTLPAAEP